MSTSTRPARLAPALVLGLALLLGCGGPPGPGATPSPAGGDSDVEVSTDQGPDRDDDGQDDDSQDDDGGHRHENTNNPPGVRHSIPNEGQSFNPTGWESGVAENCERVDLPPGCLPLAYAVEGDGDLGPDCEVLRIEPSTEGSPTIPAGTRVVVTMTCPPETGGDGDGDSGDGNGDSGDGNGDDGNGEGDGDGGEETASGSATDGNG